MAKMVFAVSNDEFTEIVRRLDISLPKNKDADNPVRGDDPIGDMVEFLHSFMIDMKSESMLGHYDYELCIDGFSIPLDTLDSTHANMFLRKKIGIVLAH